MQLNMIRAGSFCSRLFFRSGMVQFFLPAAILTTLRAARRREQVVPSPHVTIITGLEKKLQRHRRSFFRYFRIYPTSTEKTTWILMRNRHDVVVFRGSDK
jgi:hypothetical protein